MVPTLPSQRSVLRALASLRLQQVADWEAVVVVDGAVPPWLIAALESLADRRIALHSTGARRHGRGAARSLALSRCRGRWLAFVDADDWWMPAKLHTQLEVAEGRDAPSLVTTGLAVVDSRGALRGERGWDGAGGPERVSRPSNRGRHKVGSVPPELHFAPSIMAMDVAKRAGFDRRLVSSEDRDFLSRALVGLRWRSLAEPLYVYDEYGQQSLRRTFASHAHRVEMQVGAGSLRGALFATARAGASLALAAGAHGIGRADWLVARRSQEPSQKLISRYALAKRLVDDELCRCGLLDS